MAVDRVDDNDLDVQVVMLPPITHEKYQVILTESEMMEAIGRAATALFTLLNQTQPKVPPMVGVVVIREIIEVPCFETDVQEVEEVAQKVIAPETVDDIVDPPALVIEEEKVPVEVAEEIAPPVVEIVEEEKIEISTPPKVDHERTLSMIESYRQQIRLMSQAATQERQLLKTQEQIQLLQQLNRGSYGISQVEDPKVDIMKRIAHFEREIRVAEQKIVELQQTLRDNQR